jgi:GAF domain-containing protein
VHDYCRAGRGISLCDSTPNAAALMEIPRDRLAEALSSLAVALLGDKSLKADLERLAGLACRLIADCSGASISMLVEGKPSTVAVTDRVTLELDVAQYDGGDGPCVQALGGELIRIGHIPSDERFPHFARGAADRRVLSVLSMPAIDHGTVVGSLNLYSRQANAFDDGAQDTATVIAAEVAHALVTSAMIGKARTTRDKLQESYDESVLLSQAEGVLMALHQCSAAQAAQLIRNAADHNAERLIATAERIVTAVNDDAEPRSESDR